MEILWWLAVPLAVTSAVALWAAWAGRPARPQVDEREAQERLGAALARPVPERARRVVPQPVERPSGVAVRRSELDPDARAERSAVARRVAGLR